MAERRRSTAGYQGIVSDLRAKILTGVYPPGQWLPSEDSMARDYGVTRMTLRRAIQMLRDEGLILAPPGDRIGHIAAEPVEMTRLGTAEFTALATATDGTVDIRVAVAEVDIARLLDIEVCADVLLRTRVQRVDGAPAAACRSWLPRSVTLGTALEQADPGPDGIEGALRALGHAPLHTVQDVASRLPTVWEYTALEVAKDKPVLAVTRVAGTKDRAVCVDEVVLRADRYTLRYQWAV